MRQSSWSLGACISFYFGGNIGPNCIRRYEAVAYTPLEDPKYPLLGYHYILKLSPIHAPVIELNFVVLQQYVVLRRPFNELRPRLLTRWASLQATHGSEEEHESILSAPS